MIKALVSEVDARQAGTPRFEGGGVMFNPLMDLREVMDWNP